MYKRLRVVVVGLPSFCLFGDDTAISQLQQEIVALYYQGSFWMDHQADGIAFRPLLSTYETRHQSNALQPASTPFLFPTGTLAVSW